MGYLLKDPMYDVSSIRTWIACNYEEYEYATQLAESCADALDIYEERINYTIPEIVYEIAMEFIHEN
jgi:hypothetical protein